MSSETNLLHRRRDVSYDPKDVGRSGRSTRYSNEYGDYRIHNGRIQDDVPEPIGISKEIYSLLKASKVQAGGGDHPDLSNRQQQNQQSNWYYEESQSRGTEHQRPERQSRKDSVVEVSASMGPSRRESQENEKPRRRYRSHPPNTEAFEDPLLPQQAGSGPHGNKPVPSSNILKDFEFDDSMAIRNAISGHDQPTSVSAKRMTERKLPETLPNESSKQDGTYDFYSPLSLKNKNNYARADALRDVNRRTTSSSRIPSSNRLDDNQESFSKFKKAEGAGAKVCVCAAAKYSERERIQLMGTKDKLTEEFAKLRQLSKETYADKAKYEKLLRDCERRLAEVKKSENYCEERQRLLKSFEETVQQDKVKLEQKVASYHKKENEFASKEVELADLRKEYDVMLKQVKKKESELAAEYLTFENKMRSFEEKMHCFEDHEDRINQELSERESKLDQQEQELEQRLATITIEEKDLEHRIEEVEQQRKSLEDTHNLKLEELRFRETIIENQENEIKAQTENMQAAQAKLETDHKEIEAQHKEMKTKQGELERLQKEIEDDRNDMDSFHNSLKKKEEELEGWRQDEHASLKAWEVKLLSLEKNLEEKRSMIESGLKDLDEKQASIDVKWQKLEEFKAEMNDLKCRLDEGKENLDVEINEKTTELNNKMSTFTARHNSLVKKEMEIAEKEKALNEREQILKNEEAQAQWINEIKKSVREQEEQLSLQLSQLKLSEDRFQRRVEDFELRIEREEARLNSKSSAIRAQETECLRIEQRLIQREKRLGLANVQDDQPSYHESVSTQLSRQRSQSVGLTRQPMNADVMQETSRNGYETAWSIKRDQDHSPSPKQSPKGAISNKTILPMDPPPTLNISESPSARSLAEYSQNDSISEPARNESDYPNISPLKFSIEQSHLNPVDHFDSDDDDYLLEDETRQQEFSSPAISNQNATSYDRRNLILPSSSPVVMDSGAQNRSLSEFNLNLMNRHDIRDDAIVSDDDTVERCTQISTSTYQSEHEDLDSVVSSDGDHDSMMMKRKNALTERLCKNITRNECYETESDDTARNFEPDSCTPSSPSDTVSRARAVSKSLLDNSQNDGQFSDIQRSPGNPFGNAQASPKIISPKLTSASPKMISRQDSPQLNQRYLSMTLPARRDLQEPTLNNPYSDEVNMSNKFDSSISNYKENQTLEFSKTLPQKSSSRPLTEGISALTDEIYKLSSAINHTFDDGTRKQNYKQH